jgi:biotin carboxylase
MIRSEPSANPEQAATAMKLKGKRVLLLVPAVTYRAADFLAAADQLDLDVVIGSDGALALGGRPVIRVDSRDLDGTVERLVSGIGTADAVVAADAPMLILAAKVAASLGLQHNPVDAVMAAENKADQRRLWAAAGVPQPGFEILSASAAHHAIIDAAARLGFPCVVKPVSLSGSRGVLRVDDKAGVSAAATLIREILAEAGRSDQEPIAIEQYVPGWELSVDGLLMDGDLTVTAIFDKPDSPDGPTFEETMLITPSRLTEQLLATVVGIVERAAATLGLRYGPIHAELRIDARHGEERPVMLELAARSIGGLCSRALQFPGGVSLEAMVLMNSVGCRVATPHLARTAGVLMLPVERAGVLERIDGRADVLAVPGVTGLSITVPLGQVVRPLPWGDRYLGFIFAEGDHVHEVQRALSAARQHLRPVIS